MAQHNLQIKSGYWKGKKLPKEVRIKLSEAKKKNPVRYWLGKNRLKETKEKISKALKKEQKIEFIKCGCGCEKKFNKYDLRNRERKFIKTHIFNGRRKGFQKEYMPWNKGRHLTEAEKKQRSETSKRLELWRVLFKPSVREKALRRAKKGIIKWQQSKKPTSIEVKVYQELKNKGLLFEKQYLINGKFLVDAYIPSLNLVIEADGKYWHSLDKVIKKDKAENAYLTKCGFKLLRLGEDEINDGSFKERLVN